MHKRRVIQLAVPLLFITHKMFAPGRTFSMPTPLRLSTDDPNSLQDWHRYSFRSQRYSLAIILPSRHTVCQEIVVFSYLFINQSSTISLWVTTISIFFSSSLEKNRKSRDSALIFIWGSSCKSSPYTTITMRHMLPS